MKFYNREHEIAQLQRLSVRAYSGSATMTLLVGRRRIGKTELLKQCFKSDANFIYFFISRKSEVLLCAEFMEILEGKVQLPVWGKIDTLLKFFEFILQQSSMIPLTVVFDEFQELQYLDPSIFSGIQNLWDTYKKNSKLHLIVCGSIYSIMCNLFENNKQPLFGRADTKIYLKPLKVKCLQQILIDEKKYTPENLLTLYTIVGGVPRYLELLQMDHAWPLSSILATMLSANSFFISEGKNALIEELGKDYRIYFSILSLIATGKTARSAIESVLQISVGGYLENLEQEFSILRRHKPIFAKENSRTQKYFIEDNFFNFWFRYFYKHQSALEIGNFNYVINIIKEEFSVYSGKYLELMLRELLADSGEYNRIGSYWDKDNINEIDIVACNDHEKKLVIAEVKLQHKKINLGLLQHKAAKLIASHPNYEVQFRGYSLDNLAELLSE